MKTAIIAMLIASVVLTGCLSATETEEFEIRNAELEAKNAELGQNATEWEKKAEDASSEVRALNTKNRELEAKNAELETKLERYTANATYTIFDSRMNKEMSLTHPSSNWSDWIEKPEPGTYYRIRSSVSFLVCFKSSQHGEWCNLKTPIEPGDPVTEEWHHKEDGTNWFDEMRLRPENPGPANFRISVIAEGQQR